MYKYHLAILSGTFNRLDMLRAMLDSVRADMPRGITYYFCIADGGSTDGTIEYLRTQSDVRLIEQGELLGGVKAYTEAGKTIPDAKYTLIGNDDIEILPGSIAHALVHLEDNPTCGGVAFYTNQPIEGRPAGSYNVQYHPAHKASGERLWLPYAQVGVFHNWLAHKAGWWGGDDKTFGARHYGADNFLSARIQELGYTIDPVAQCRYNDKLPPDALRQLNSERGREDAQRYVSRFPNGALVPDAPTIPPEHERQLRVLYLPIYEPEHGIQYERRRAMRDALAERFLVCEVPYTLIDYRNKNPQERRNHVTQVLADTMAMWKPDLVLSQIHDAYSINANSLAAIRARHPRALWVNWCGDVWPDNLLHADMMVTLRYVDMQLTVNASVLETYERNHITAAYWQIGYEPPYGIVNQWVVRDFDVVFMGNNYSKERSALYESLSGLDDAKTRIGFYGRGWPVSQGDTLYDFATSEAILQLAKIAIGDNQFPDARGFVSNRLIQTLGAGGAILLHQHVDGLDELLGLEAGVHYVEWTDFKDLLSKVRYWLSPSRAKRRKEMAAKARQVILEKHTFATRLDELFDIIKVAHKAGGRNVRLLYHFPHGNPRDFGVRTQTRTLRYLPDVPMTVTTEEAVYLERQDKNWYRIEG